MAVTIALALALLGPPATEPAAAEPPPEPIERGYEGPAAIEPVAGTEAPEVAGEKVEEAPPALKTIETETPHPPKAVKSDIYKEVDKKREAPRLLTTIDDFPLEEQAVIGKRRVKFYPGIQVRNQIGYVSPFTLDRFGDKYEEGGFSTGRIRWNPKLVIRKNYKFVGTLDLVNGRWAPSGSEDDVIDEIIDRGEPPGRTSLPIVDPRELYFEARLPVGLLRIGQQSFTWSTLR